MHVVGGGCYTPPLVSPVTPKYVHVILCVHRIILLTYTQCGLSLCVNRKSIFYYNVGKHHACEVYDVIVTRTRTECL
jgi:hypothetical protein